MDLGLEAKNVLITGSSKGIGLAIAELFADEGANVSICARNADDVAKVVKSLSAKGVKAWGRGLDVADPTALKAWIEGAATELGGIDTIVCNVAAGVVFLASPLASRVSGTNLIIDGALTKAV
jgi:3-oxoacyl-[acyl-carrier protein] reductase